MRNGSLIEERKVAGIYEMTVKVEQMDWDEMRKKVKLFRQTLEADRAEQGE